jgi:hypothetical protein
VASPFHYIDVIHVYAFEVTIYQKNDGQTDRGFGRGYGYDKYGEYLTHKFTGGDEPGESHKVDVNRIEHKLNGHKNANGISASQDPEDPYAEKYGTQSQKVSQANQELLLSGYNYGSNQSG